METEVWPITQILVDGLILTVLGLSTPMIKSFVPITKHGFFCNDEDIMYPILGESPVSNEYLHPATCLVNIFAILLVEYTKQRKTPERIKLCRLRVPKWLHNSYTVLRVFAFGILSAILTATFLKGRMGRLRPIFLAACRPNVDCALPQNQHVYHAHYQCTADYVPLNIWFSFPSGHCNVAAFGALFLAVYLQKEVKWKRFGLARAGVQTLLVVATLYVAVSQTLFHEHRWSDVAGGCAIGGGWALFVTLCL